MSPYTVTAAVWLASVVGMGFWMYDAGGNAQAVKDQAAINRTNKALEEQSATANKMLQDAHTEVVSALAAREALKTQLENIHVKAQSDTNALRAQLASERLRFRTTSAKCGDGSGNSSGAQSDPAGNPASTLVELPAEVEGRLRQLAFDADTLRDDYALLYGWAHSVKCSGKDN